MNENEFSKIKEYKKELSSYFLEKISNDFKDIKLKIGKQDIQFEIQVSLFCSLCMDFINMAFTNIAGNSNLKSWIRVKNEYKKRFDDDYFEEVLKETISEKTEEE